MFTAFNDYFKTADAPEGFTEPSGSSPNIIIRIRLDDDLTIIEHQALLGGCGDAQGVIERHGPGYNDLVHPDDRQRVKAELNKALRYHARADLKHRVVLGPIIRHVWMQGGIIRSNKSVHFDMLLRDITQQVADGAD